MTRFANAPWPLKAAYVSGLAAGGLALLSGVAALIALAGLRRLSSHLDAAAIPGWFWYFRGDPQVRRWLTIGALSTSVLALVAAVAIGQALRRPLHGAARWANESELRRAGLRANAGILLGRKAGRPLVFGGVEHVMLYAPTRTGKGVGVVIPNLLSWPHSVIVLDVKRENWEATAGFRAAHGQQTLLFDPLDPEGRTARYNPFGYIDRDDPIQVIDELQRIAAMLFPIPPVTDPFWAESARTGFLGVGAYLAGTSERPFTVGALYAELTEGDPRTRFPKLIRARAQSARPLSAPCVRALTDFCASSENTFASIRQTLTSRLNLWVSPRVCAATDASDFDLRDLRTRRMSLYLATSPENLARVAPLYGLLLQQLVDLSCRQRPTVDRHPHQVLLLLDEFARLGHAAVIAKGFAYVAGYGLRLLPVLQSPAQLRGEYGPDLAEEILSNCAVEVVFTPKELPLANALSERLGFTTVRSAARSRPSGLARGHRSVSESDQRRALLLPQELMQLPADDLIVLKAGAPPIRGRKITYYRERLFTRRLRPAPIIAPLQRADASGDRALSGQTTETVGDDPLVSQLEGLRRAGDGLEPLPPVGATAEAVDAWVERYIDAAARQPELEADDDR